MLTSWPGITPCAQPELDDGMTVPSSVRREARYHIPRLSRETLEGGALGYQLTQDRKIDGTAACWDRARLSKDTVWQVVLARPTW